VPGGGGVVKNLDSVFWAYVLGWAIFFGFYLSIAKRSNDLRAEVERLKKSAFEKSREK
jgi:hypothetical protein